MMEGLKIMICAKCMEEGKKSRVSSQGGTVTLMYCKPYWDEDGAYHHHDSNIHTTGFKCSEGHSWIERSHGVCPAPGCTWNDTRLQEAKYD
jgi:hypothetical protein